MAPARSMGTAAVNRCVGRRVALSMLAAAALLLAACEKQAPVSSAPPEEITAPAPAANPQPDVNAEPVERAAPPMVKAVAMGEFEPGNPVATAVTGKLTIEDNMMRGDNGASFTTERVAIVNGADQYSAGNSYAQAMLVAADQEIELRRVLEQTPPTQMPSNAMCGGSPTGFIALAKVMETGGEVVKVIGLKGADMPAASAKGIELCASTMYLPVAAPPKG